MSTDVAIRWARTPLSDDQRQLALAQLTAAERTREPSDGFLAGRLLLRELAPEREVTATCPDCGAEHGRPRLAGGSGPAFASISHAGDLTVVAVAGLPIGIDVEPDDADVPSIFASDVAGWTAIEAVLKADGRGLRVDPAEVRFARRQWSFRTTDAAAAAPVVRNDHGRRGATARLHGVDYEVRWLETAPGFTVAVARAVASRTATSGTGRRATVR